MILPLSFPLIPPTVHTGFIRDMKYFSLIREKQVIHLIYGMLFFNALSFTSSLLLYQGSETYLLSKSEAGKIRILFFCSFHVSLK